MAGRSGRLTEGIHHRFDHVESCTALRSLAGSVALLRGCLSAPTPAGPTAPADTGSPTAKGRMLSIDTVGTSTHALRLNDLGTSPAGSALESSSHSEREQAVLPQAIDGEFHRAANLGLCSGFARPSVRRSCRIARYTLPLRSRAFSSLSVLAEPAINSTIGTAREAHPKHRIDPFRGGRGARNSSSRLHA